MRIGDLEIGRSATAPNGDDLEVFEIFGTSMPCDRISFSLDGLDKLSDGACSEPRVDDCIVSLLLNIFAFCGIKFEPTFVICSKLA